MGQTLRDYLKPFCVVLALCSIVVLILDIYHLFPLRAIEVRVFIFTALIIITLYFFSIKEYELFLSQFSFAILYNPFLPIILPYHFWLAFEFVTIILFAHTIYFMFYSQRAKSIEKIAYLLDQYLKELDHNIAHLTYHQISLYINSRYAQHAQINSRQIIWSINTIPTAQFIINAEDFTNRKTDKGQITVKFKEDFDLVEVYLNFNFSEAVRYAVRIIDKPKRIASYTARSLRYILVKRYHYVDL